MTGIHFKSNTLQSLYENPCALLSRSNSLHVVSLSNVIYIRGLEPSSGSGVPGSPTLKQTEQKKFTLQLNKSVAILIAAI